MKNLRLLAFTTGTLFLSSAFMLAACSDDTVVTPIDTDSGVDGGTDAKADTSTPDATDSGPDATADAGITLDNYITNVGEALCNAITRCCFGNPNVPDGGAVTGGTFGRAQCVKQQAHFGFEQTNFGAEDLTSGTFVLDQAKAQQCMQQAEAMQCDLSGASLRQIRSVCFEAISGTVAKDKACKADIECAPGSFCNPTDPSSLTNRAGTCQPLRGAGGNCGDVANTGDEDTDQQLAEYACSSRAAGDTGLHCDSFDFTAGPDGAYRARADWKCMAGVDNGQKCSSNVWCKTGICDTANDGICKDPLEILQNSCTAFVIPAP
ncbi:hypothetical protein AKJ09_07468 [Labilithrix luteola]|uniref:Lipoprotein n=1 Tax=Labilithrix luteola TaxID=1391654 RepID=A0A0K1Q5Y0_9BACT|nr:hypothetical protein [Labilithrix luteola]AKV00805.1 hypothetical protein AKJ09_07468 [Labilithrix luteola]